MSELKPCPFCGGNAKLMTYKTPTFGEVFYVACRVCGNETKVKLADEEAIEAWNRRVDNEQR